MKEELVKQLSVVVEAVKLANRRGAFELNESVAVNQALVSLAQGIDSVCTTCEALQAKQDEPKSESEAS